MTATVVTIKLSEYKRLLEADDWLECLNCAGVDNWQGIEEALNMQGEMPFNFEEARSDINQ